MICISVDQDDDSEESVKNWVAEVRGVSEAKPIIFVLTKKDLLEEEDFEPKFNVRRMIDEMNEHEVQLLV